MVITVSGLVVIKNTLEYRQQHIAYLTECNSVTVYKGKWGHVTDCL